MGGGPTGRLRKRQLTVTEGCSLLTSTLGIATRAQSLGASLAGELFHVADGASDENHRLRLHS